MGIVAKIRKRRRIFNLETFLQNDAHAVVNGAGETVDVVMAARDAYPPVIGCIKRDRRRYVFYDEYGRCICPDTGPNSPNQTGGDLYFRDLYESYVNFSEII